MDSPLLLDVVSWTAIVCTIIQFLSGILICWQIKKIGNTAEISSAPFLTGIVSCTLWLKYGILQYDHTLIIVNAIGLMLLISYTMFYYWFTINKAAIHRQIFLTCMVLFPILIYLKFFVVDIVESSAKSGLMACCAGVIFCASPLLGVVTVYKTKSTETLPLPLILSTFVVTLLWFFYGFLLADHFIQIPNLIGCCISGLQLFLFLLYPSQKMVSPLLLRR